MNKLLAVLLLLAAGLYEDLRAIWREFVQPWETLDREMRRQEFETLAREMGEWPTSWLAGPMGEA